jgi:hypothetical protein
MMPRAYRVAVVLALLLAGCGGGSYRTALVSGRVTMDGKPLAYATVTFVPVTAPGEKHPPPSSAGITDADGRYSLALAAEARTDGAVVGKHKVMILLGQEAAAHDTAPTFHKQVPEQYNRKSTLECEVPAGGRQDANFDLKSR